MQGHGPVITTTEMHTGGEPVRIVESGYPPVPGTTILDKRRYAREHLDHLRTLLMHEPRGHFDMYGVIPVEPDLPEADLAVLFMHNEGYSTMCGHATIALGRYAVDRGLVPAVEPRTEMVIQCPCGPVTVVVEVKDGKAGQARFTSVESFAPILQHKVVVKPYGTVTYDVGYGGAFYAVADAAQFGLDVRSSPVGELVVAANALSDAVRVGTVLSHPESSELSELYGSILTDGHDGERVSANVCVFADSQVDRSPTGSGVTARMAIRHAHGQVSIGEERVFESLVGSTMTGRVVASRVAGDLPAVVVEVGGRAYYTGSASFLVEPDDPFAIGFLVR
ncbi:MAG: proline racemase family protein [bacterium]|nr:proline racemase family protein [bacterium]